MINRTWQAAIKASAQPDRAKEALEKLARSGVVSLKGWGATEARALAALFAGSKALGELLLRHPDWLNGALAPEVFLQPRRMAGLESEAKESIDPAIELGDYQAALTRVRQFKERETLRIAFQDLAQPGQAPLIIGQLSNVADVCVGRIYEICRRQWSDRAGKPYHRTAAGKWEPTPFCIFGLGKLGGQELNYSSDIDILCIYGDEGSVFRRRPTASTKPGNGMTNHQYFTRLVESIIAEVSRRTTHGWLYRIDLRLRPEGDAGPLVRSLPSCENYYAQWGQTFERMMLIKARCVAGDRDLATEFLEMINPFRFPRSVSAFIPDEISRMKHRIEREVLKSDELDRNVKLGKGGIREIEFIVQTLQLLHAGRLPFLQHHQTLPTLEKLRNYQLLKESESRKLAAGYVFLRDVEHRLQMEENLQTHVLPVSGPARARLARLMGLGTWKSFAAALRRHNREVRAIFDALLGSGGVEEDGLLPADFEDQKDEWLALLKEYGFRDPPAALRMARNIIQGPGYVHISPRTVELGSRIMRAFLDHCPGKRRQNTPTDRESILSDPDRVLIRLESYVGAYGARPMLYEAWTSNPSLFDLMLRLFDRSEFLAEQAIREPDLVDDLAQSGLLRRHKSADQILTDLRYGKSEDDQGAWIRRYFRTEFMRLGLRDILGLSDWERNTLELSGLAEACLQYALEVTVAAHGIRSCPLAIIGLGKLGGRELDYGSDLDVLFVADGKVRDRQKWQRVAVEIIELLSAKTAEGTVFDLDARLRPDGEDGLLVNTLDAYENYYRERAQLWEIQALTRARPVAGDQQVGARFEALTRKLTHFGEPPKKLHAYRRDWREQIAAMRLRIQKERTPPGTDDLAIKTGAGGLVDAEFLAQMFNLEMGWHEPQTLACLERAEREGILTPQTARDIIENYRALRRVEAILRRWSFAAESVLPEAAAPRLRVARRCGFDSIDAFMKFVARNRQSIRRVVEKFLPLDSSNRKKRGH